MKNYIKKSTWVLVLGLMLPLVSTDALVGPRDHNSERSSDLLQNLGSFFVVIEELGDLGTGVGIQSKELINIANKTLKEVGIDPSESSDKPFLLIHFQLLKVETESGNAPLGYAASVTMELKEWMNLPRRPDLRLAVSTWDKTGALVIAPPAKIKEELEKVIHLGLLRFLNEYRSVNPADENTEASRNETLDE